MKQIFAINYSETYERTYFVAAENFEEAEELLSDALMHGKVQPPEYCIDSEYKNITECWQDEVSQTIVTDNIDVGTLEPEE